MTVRRQPGSVDHALRQILDALGMEAMRAATGRQTLPSEDLIYRWTLPHDDAWPNAKDIECLDRAYDEATGEGHPIAEVLSCKHERRRTPHEAVPVAVRQIELTRALSAVLTATATYASTEGHADGTAAQEANHEAKRVIEAWDRDLEARLDRPVRMVGGERKAG